MMAGVTAGVTSTGVVAVAGGMVVAGWIGSLFSSANNELITEDKIMAETKIIRMMRICYSYLLSL
jgi:hypothetical protein